MKLKNLLFLVKVDGESAFPSLISGKYYLATALKKPRVGSFIVFPHPSNPTQLLVKKVRSIEERGLYVEGTLSWATSSKEMGFISPRAVLGTLL